MVRHRARTYGNRPGGVMPPGPVSFSLASTGLENPGSGYQSVPAGYALRLSSLTSVDPEPDALGQRRGGGLGPGVERVLVRRQLVAECPEPDRRHPQQLGGGYAQLCGELGEREHAGGDVLAAELRRWSGDMRPWPLPEVGSGALVHVDVDAAQRGRPRLVQLRTVVTLAAGPGDRLPAQRDQPGVEQPLHHVVPAVPADLVGRLD